MLNDCTLFPAVAVFSHIIVLFDFIEEKRAEGAPLQGALLHAGIMRLPPVMITVGKVDPIVKTIFCPQ